jgi:putative ABC transport system ATP-binding protein
MYISVINLKKHYSNGTSTVQALKGASFDIEKGSFNVVLGPSGAGKTSLLNCIGAMDFLSDGQIFVNSIEQKFTSDKAMTNYRKETVGFVFQSYNVLPTLSVYENIDLVSGKSTDSKEVVAMIKRVGLEKRMNHFPNELSGGELQRLCIARAICKKPDLIICDEPTGALDSKTGKKILKLLKELVETEQSTVLLATHNLHIAQLADQVIHILDGNIMNIQKNKTPITVDEMGNW